MQRPIDLFNKVTTKAYPNYTRAIEAGDDMFASYKIDTPIRLAHLFAQILYECGGGTILFENMRYKTAARLMEIFGVGRHSAAVRPEEVPGLLNNPEALGERVYGLGNPKKARELGNTRPGDGYRYRGGGLLQTTGAAAYQRMGRKAGADFYGDPDLIVDPRYALMPTIFEWNESNCNAMADKNDIRSITLAINGGLNGFDGRKALFEKIWPIANAGGTAQEAWTASAPDDTVKELQENLNDLGADPPLLVDGRYGPAVTEAVKAFQEMASIKVDGVVGPVTQAAIDLRLSSRRGSF